MTVTPRQLERIADVYDALLAPQRGASMLGRLAGQCGARAATLSLMDNANADVDAHYFTPPFSDAAFGDYFARFAEEEARARARARMGRLPCMQWVSDVDVYGLPPENPVSDWLLERFGLWRRSGLRLNDSPAHTDMLALYFDPGRGLITAEEQADVAPILPHLAKFAEVHRPFDALRRAYGAVMEALDRLQIGVAVLLRSAGIVLMNSEAERICDLDAGMTATPGRRIILADALAQQRFSAALTAAADIASGADAALSDRIVVPRLTGGEPFLLEVSPVRGTDDELDPGLRAALVFMIDPENTRPVRVDNMQALFGLTPAEAAVLKRTVEGASAQDIADARNTSVATIRAQLRAIAGKTGAPTRAALVQLALSVNPPVETARTRGDE